MVMIMITVLIIMIPSSASGNLMKKVNTDEEEEEGNKDGDDYDHSLNQISLLCSFSFAMERNTLDSIAVSILVDVVVELTNTELSIIFKSTTIVCKY